MRKQPVNNRPVPQRISTAVIQILGGLYYGKVAEKQGRLTKAGEALHFMSHITLSLSHKVADKKSI